MGCHPSHWLIFFKMVKTNQYLNAHLLRGLSNLPCLMTPGKGVYIHDLWGISGTFTDSTRWMKSPEFCDQIPNFHGAPSAPCAQAAPVAASKRPADDAATAGCGKRAKVSAGGQTCPSRLRFRKCGNVVKTGINHFMFDGIYHPYIYIYCVLGNGYCFNHINVYMYIIIYIYICIHIMDFDSDDFVVWWWWVMMMMTSWRLDGTRLSWPIPVDPAATFWGCIWGMVYGVKYRHRRYRKWWYIMVIWMGENANWMGMEQRLCGDLTNATWPLTLLSQCLNGWLLLTTVDLQKDHR